MANQTVRNDLAAPADAVADRAPAGSQRRKWPRAVATVLAALVALSTWAFASPVASSPDDPFHVASIWCAGSDSPDDCAFESELGRGTALFRVGAGGLTTTSDPIVTCHAKPAGQETCPPVAGPGLIRANDGLYPPVYYGFGGLFVGASADETVLRVRLAVVASVLLLFTLAFFSAVPSIRPAMLLSWVVVSLPLGMFLFSSTNPSSWGIAGVAAYWGALISAFQAPSRNRVLFAAGVMLLAAVMAAGARADAGAYIGVITVLGVALLARRRQHLLAVGAAALCAVIAALSVLASRQTGNVTEGFTVAQQADRSLPQLVWGLVQGLPSLLVGGTGAPWGRLNERGAALGWFDVPVPPVTWATMLMVLGALLITGIAWLPVRKAIALGVLTLVALAVPSLALLRVSSLPGDEVQPRYVLPLVFVIVGVALLRPRARPLVCTPGQVWVIIAALGIAGAAALGTLLETYTGFTGLAGVPLQADWMWSPLTSPLLLWLIGSAAWLAVAWLTVDYAIRRAPVAAEPEDDPAKEPPRVDSRLA